MPVNLAVFVAAILISNSVNIFTNVYGSDDAPSRRGPLLTSCGASLLAAALWTGVASKAEQVERAVVSGGLTSDARTRIRRLLWADAWMVFGGYLFSAVALTALSLVILLV